jgi:hypothetical protein
MAINRLECGNTAHSRNADYIRLAIKALEKQIPKKPFKTMDENNPYYKYMPWCCPCCRETLYEDTEWGEQEFAYCTDCGQKLNWEEV